MGYAQNYGRILVMKYITASCYLGLPTRDPNFGDQSRASESQTAYPFISETPKP